MLEWCGWSFQLDKRKIIFIEIERHSQIHMAGCTEYKMMIKWKKKKIEENPIFLEEKKLEI